MASITAIWSWICRFCILSVSHDSLYRCWWLKAVLDWLLYCKQTNHKRIFGPVSGAQIELPWLSRAIIVRSSICQSVYGDRFLFLYGEYVSNNRNHAVVRKMRRLQFAWYNGPFPRTPECFWLHDNAWNGRKILIKFARNMSATRCVAIVLSFFFLQFPNLQACVHLSTSPIYRTTPTSVCTLPTAADWLSSSLCESGRCNLEWSFQFATNFWCFQVKCRLAIIVWSC